MYKNAVIEIPANTPFAPAHLARLIWCVIFLVPLGLWHWTTDVYTYWAYGAPPGQLYYVFSKLFGLYAGMLLWFQAVSTLLKSTTCERLLPRWTFKAHRLLGTTLFSVTAIHIAFFVTAVSIRKGQFAWPLLFPDIHNFYHGAITLGVMGFYTLIVAIVAALARSRFPTMWRYIHRATVLVAVLGLVHSFLIGTETRYGVYGYFYGVMMSTLLVAIAVRWRSSGVRNGHRD